MRHAQVLYPKIFYIFFYLRLGVYLSCYEISVANEVICIVYYTINYGYKYMLHIERGIQRVLYCLKVKYLFLFPTHS
jgi:hypothetical protein